ncbi:ComF family protein [Chloroflexia bacterium SDU3-3]|nr:ComF family protein [Chloroflexia bacterium SDU3-3]
MIAQLIESLLALLFPERCAGCGALGEPLCERCRSALDIYPDHVRGIPALDAISIGYIYQRPIREAIHQLKYRRRRRVAQPLGQLLAELARPHAPDIDAVMPVPMHASRLAERGFNQAELLASAAARGAGLPCVAAGLVRTRATSQQAHLNAQQRQANMRGVFAWQAAAPPPARILLVDDVLTTGATMSACAIALREAGSREVYGLALARSIR